MGIKSFLKGIADSVFFQDQLQSGAVVKNIDGKQVLIYRDTPTGTEMDLDFSSLNPTVPEHSKKRTVPLDPQQLRAFM